MRIECKSEGKLHDSFILFTFFWSAGNENDKVLVPLIRFSEISSS